jgi:hypothetical protein
MHEPLHHRREIRMERDNANGDYTESLKNRIMDSGADLVGIADAEPLRELKLYPPDLLGSFTRVVAIAIRLPVEIFRQITGSQLFGCFLPSSCLFSPCDWVLPISVTHISH